MTVTVISPPVTFDLERRTAQFHASCVRRKLEQMALPLEQKQKLMNTILNEYNERKTGQ